MTRQSAKSAPVTIERDSNEAPSKRSAKIRTDEAAQEVEQITLGPQAARCPRQVAAPQTNPAEQAVEDIPPAVSVPPRADAPRLSNGARIVEIRGQHHSERIARRPPTVLGGDEMAYKKLFTRFEEAFLTADIAALRACLSPAFQWHPPTGPAFYGREEALAEMERRFVLPNVPKFSGTVWRFKDTTVIQTYEVEFLGPDGQWRRTRGMDLYDIGNGLITRKDAYWKMVP